MLDQTYLDTAHLLQRAGFGASVDTINAAVKDGLAATTDALLHPEGGLQDPDDTDIITRLADMIPDRKNNIVPTQFVKIWWVHRMLTTQHPLVEKMVLFWHGHFTSKLGDGESMLAQNQLFRQQALGNFRTLAQAVSQDPAMLRYLNGNENFKAHPNENYARELMELFTCGIGNYTEDDVKAAARAFSGWNLRRDQFFFNPRQHDDDGKTFLGHIGDWNGSDIVDMLVAHPATARRLCKQLFEYFGYPDPEPAVLNALTKTYYESGYDIRAIVGQILTSDAFHSEKAQGAIIKCPVQYVVGTIKLLGLEPAFDVSPGDIVADTDADTPMAGGAAAPPGPLQRLRGTPVDRLSGLTVAMRSMGQDILAPPSVKGWDGEEAWINSATLLNRINFANRISQSHALYDDLAPRVRQYGEDNHEPDETTAWVEYLALTLGPLSLATSTRDTLLQFANAEGPYAVAGQTAAVGANLTRTVAATPAATMGGGAMDPGAGASFPTAPSPDAARPVGGARGRMLALIPLIMATPEYQVC